jgi:dihydroorotate dehydrogenase electron transfer subunit
LAGDDAVPLRGPGGQTLTLHRSRPRPLLIGEGAGIGPTLFIAERVREVAAPPPRSSAPQADARTVYELALPVPWRLLVLLGSTGLPFPFRPRPSVIVVPGIPTGVIACMPLLEEWGIASRLASTLDLPGCFEGPVITLADSWLSSLSPAELAEVEIFANGPDQMVREAMELASKYGIACP